jgi:uncharacterized protein (TIGR03437 family)
MPQNPLARGLLLVLTPLLSIAQNAPTLVGAGYALPQITVAPGQIVKLQVTGLKTVLNEPIQATGLPLPLELAGVSVTLKQDRHLAAETVLKAPLVSLEQTSFCADYPYPPDCRVTLITVQIPMEAEPLLWYENEPITSITISENGNDRTFRITTSMASAHVVACPLGPCVAHSDGTLVTPNSPARPGETVVIYVYGLGATDPQVPSGASSPVSGAKVVNVVSLAFNFTANAGARLPVGDPRQPPAVAPEWAGLTPGQVGLYQINVKLPNAFPNVPACNLLQGVGTVQSNLTIEITVTYKDEYAASPSVDAAAICVRP